jgi:glycerol-3-phosphate acyltransferase PlsY
MGWKAAFILLAYLLGSVPSGHWLGRWVGDIDIRTVGSKNIGATNVARTLGRKWGLLTLLLDMAKGALPVALALYLWPANTRQNVLCVSVIGLAAFLGHLSSIFLRFRGGKGVATALGITLVLVPPAALLSVGLFILMVYRFRYVSLGSVSAALSLPVFVTIIGSHPYYIGLTVTFSVLILLRHRENLRSLLQGTERKL